MTTQMTKRAGKMLTLWAGCVAACTMAHGAVFYLRTGVITNTMPDGTNVVMMGFARDTSAGSMDGAVTVPGPELVVAPGDGTLTIHLDNRLAVPVSVVIPGQVAAAGPVPTRSGVDGRAMSFTHEAAPGGTASYTWNNVRAGLFLYQSGSHAAVQVQMGLYGALKKNTAAQLAYPGVPFSSEVILLYSEIDPALHHAVATGNYGVGLDMSSTLAYEPKYFMINGRSYTNGAAPILAGQPGGNILLRFLNAGLKTHVPIVNGAYLRVVAEDGFPYAFAKDQYSLLLAAGKTLDVMFRPMTTGRYALYDRRLALVNGMNSPGGMLANLDIAGVPLRSLTANVSPAGAGSIVTNPLPQPNGLYADGTVVTLSESPTAGYAFTNWTGDASGSAVSVQVTMTADRTVTANFFLATTPWGNAVDLGGGWKWLAWFGYFSDTGSGWIYHMQHGWMYTASTSASDIWLWTADMGWLWTSDTVYPWLWRDADSSWVWYLKDSSGPRWFYNSNSGLWESR